MSPLRRAASLLMIFLVAATALTPAHAAFHLWNIREVYSDASGTLQFIEFFTTAPGEDFIGGHQIVVRAADGSQTNTFTIPSNLSGSTANKAFLIGTAGIQAAGAPAPNFIIPSNFLFTGGGTITFFGPNGGSYTSLPTDGVNSLNWTPRTVQLNSPQNFAGQIGFISPPNQPPSVSITNPGSSALFPAPGPVPVGVAASDANGSVTNVDLLTNNVVAVSKAAGPFTFAISNLAAGFHSLRARAVDNQGSAATSSPVVVRIAQQPVLSAVVVTNAPAFYFHSATGIIYVVERSSSFSGFQGVVTNAGTGGQLWFYETDFSPAQRNYRVRLQ